MYDIGFIGFGNMARAIAGGISSTSIKIAAFDPHVAESGGGLVSAGFSMLSSGADVVKNCKFVILAVKPANLEAVAGEIRNHLTQDNIIISILAGTPVKKLKFMLGENTRIVRVMPNLAATVGRSMSAIVFDGSLSGQEHGFVKALFEAVGHVKEIDEGLMDAVTAVSGSGIAYFYKFMSCMIESGVMLGISKADSQDIILATMEGALASARADERPLENMIDAVCSKGGTTIEAIKVFNESNLNGTVAKACKAAYLRSKEISGELTEI